MTTLKIRTTEAITSVTSVTYVTYVTYVIHVGDSTVSILQLNVTVSGYDRGESLKSGKRDLGSKPKRYLVLKHLVRSCQDEVTHLGR